MKIPDGFIEDADTYSVAPADDLAHAMEIGGKIMFNLMVKEQMDAQNIIATTGVEDYEDAEVKSTQKNTCLIIVAYTWPEIRAFYLKARKEVDRLVALGLDEGKI